MIETYSILLIDILSAVVSYALALFIRFNLIHYENYPKQFHLMVGAYIVVLCLLYNMFLDANRNFFQTIRRKETKNHRISQKRIC